MLMKAFQKQQFQKYFISTYFERKIKFKERKIKLNSIINNKKYKLTLDAKISKDNIHYKFSSLKNLKKIFTDLLERVNHFKIKDTNDLMPLKTDINIKKRIYNKRKD